MNNANIIYQLERIEHTKKKFHALGIRDWSGKSMLDMGCNSGMFCRFAIDQGAKNVVGIDIDQTLIDHAIKHVPEARFVTTRFESLDLGQQRFDFVVVASAIHYTNDFIIMSNLLRKHVLPGGSIIVEGGLFDPEGHSALNIPIPGWRQIGDHCRQMSFNFLKQVVFKDRICTVFSESLNQGGDNLSRYVVISPDPSFSGSLPIKRQPAYIDINEFLKAIAISEHTISDKYQISKFIHAISDACKRGISSYDDILNDPTCADLVAEEIIFCTADWATEINFVTEPSTCFEQRVKSAISKSIKTSDLHVLF